MSNSTQHFQVHYLIFNRWENIHFPVLFLAGPGSMRASEGQQQPSESYLPIKVEDCGKTGNIWFRRQKEDVAFRVNDDSGENSASIF